MHLPFSREQFLDVFAAYNANWWPVAVALWTATLALFVARAAGRNGGPWALGLLAAQWAWSAAAYHADLFSRINPAAWLFAVLFLIEAGLLTWYVVVQPPPQPSPDEGGSRWFGYGLMAYGLLYPVIGLAAGESYPRMPTFGVPCPTTVVTIGFLMLMRAPIPLSLAIVPILWAAIGGSAAFTLGMYQDLALPVAGVALAYRTLSSLRVSPV